MKTCKAMVDEAQKEGWYHVNGLTVHVRVLDIRTVFSRTDYLVSPVDGGGETWVSADKVSWS